MNFDSIILESLYEVISEGRKDVKNTLEKLLGPDQKNLIDDLLDADPSGSKNDCIRLAKFIKEKVSPDDVLNTASIYFAIKSVSQIGQDINRFRTFKDFQEFSRKELVRTIIRFVDGNTKNFDSKKKPEDIKAYLKNNSDYQKIRDSDQSDSDSDSIYIAKIYAASKKNTDLDQVIHAYDAYVLTNAGENHKPLSAFANINELNQYLNANAAGGQTSIGGATKQQLEDQAIYEDDNIKVWRIDNVRDSINYTHNIDIGKHSWCIGYPIDTQGTQSNQWKNYSFSEYCSLDGKQKDIGSTFYTINIKSLTDKNHGNGYFTLQARPFDVFDYTPAENGTRSGYSWETLLRDKVPEFQKLTPTANQKYQPVKVNENIDEEDMRNYNPEAVVNKPEKVPNAPRITNYKDIFKYIKPSQRTIEKVKTFENLGRNFSIEVFNKLTSGEKNEYFQLGYPPNIAIWNELSDKTKNTFISAGKKLEPDIFATLSRKLLETWLRARRGSLGLTLNQNGINWNKELNVNDLPVIMKNNNIFELAKRNPSVVDILLNMVPGTEYTNDNRVVELVMASPIRANNHVLQEIQNGKKVQDIDPRYFEGISRDPNVAKSFLKNFFHGKNDDFFRNIPEPIIRVIVGDPADTNSGDPQTAYLYLKWWVKNNKHINQINPNIFRVLGKNDQSVDQYVVPAIEAIIRAGQGDDLLNLPNVPDIFIALYGHALELSEGEEIE
jgi:hypothetical protein